MRSIFQILVKVFTKADRLYVHMSLKYWYHLLFLRHCCNSSYGKAKTAHRITPTLGRIFLVFLLLARELSWQGGGGVASGRWCDNSVPQLINKITAPRNWPNETTTVSNCRCYCMGKNREIATALPYVLLQQQIICLCITEGSPSNFLTAA